MNKKLLIIPFILLLFCFYAEGEEGDGVILNHGEYVSSQDDKMKAALSEVGMPEASNRNDCKDKDGDGFYVGTGDCGPIDCNDKDSQVMPPVSGMIIDSDVIFCPGEYILESGMTVVSDNVTVDCDGAIIIGNNIGSGIRSSNNGIEIKNCTFSNFQRGIELAGLSLGNNTIKNSYFDGNSFAGIYLSYVGKNNNIINNQLSNNGNGIWLSHSDTSLIKANKIEGSGSYGILMYYVNDSIVEENHISNCGWDSRFDWGSGISMAYVNQRNEIRKNVLIDNPEANIRMRGRWPLELPMYNKFYGNDLYSKGFWGLGIDNIFCVECVGNNYFDGAYGPTCPATCSD